MVRRRGRPREGLDAAELVTQPMRGGVRGGWVLQLFSSIEAGGGDRGFGTPHLAGVVFSAAAWPIRGAW